MFSWFTGSDEPLKHTEAQAPGFHPIALPATAPASPTTNIGATAATAGAPPAAASPVSTTSSAPAAVAQPEAAPSLLFDGMELGRSRRRRPCAAAPAASTAPASALQDGEPQRVLQESGTAGSSSNAENEKRSSPSAAASPELRHRLERFYRHYNPAKLAQADVILEAYRGREAELFRELAERYGEEPATLRTAQLTSTTTTTASAPPPLAAASESEGSAFRFISPTAEAAVAAWAVPPAEEEAKENEESEEEAPPVQQQQQQQRAVDAEPLSKQAPSPSSTHSPAPVLSAPSASTPASSEDDSETMEERHRRELRFSQGALLEARAALAAVLREAQEALRVRQESVAHIHDLEKEIQACVQAERYREADALSSEVAAAAADVRRCDDVWAALGRRVSSAQRQLEEAVRAVAAVLRTHEAELSAQAEADAAAAFQQRSGDDADLRLREEKVAVRQEELAVRRAAAAARVKTAQAAQAAVQQRVAAAVSATRTQRDDLADEVAQLDTRIDELRAQLRRFEERRGAARAQLQAVAAQLEAAEAAHASALSEAADVVAMCERDAQGVAQQCDDAAAEHARIAAERAAREAAAEELRRTLQDREEERNAVHRRTRALEHETIPASDCYWRAWQDLLDSRERGADVLFEVPAATRPEETRRGAPSALTRKTDLLKQLEELAGEVAADDALRREAQRRVDACDERIAPLTAAKTAAVASKNFKAAQQCADELKVVQLRRESCQGDVDLYDGQVRALERTMARLRGELAKAEAETQRYATEFCRDYGAAVRAFNAVVGDTPDYVQLPKASQSEDELAGAARALWAGLQQEWRCVAERGALHTSGSAAASGEEGRDSSTEPAKRVEAGGAAAAGPSAESTASEPETSAAEDVQQRLGTLRKRLEEAIAEEAFDECDRLQSSIEVLEAQQRASDGDEGVAG